MKAGHLYILSTILLAIFSVPTSHAQSTLTMGFTYAKPIDELATANYRNGYGLYMEVMSRDFETRLPIDLQFGGRLNLTQHGEENIQTNLLSPFVGPGEYSLSNKTASFSGVARLITPAHHFVRFYVDGFIGSSVFYSTETLLPTEEHPDYELFVEEDCNANVSHSSWGFHYGATGGVMIKVAPTARIDLRTTFTRGSNVEFINLNSLQQTEQNVFNHTTSRSALDMVQFQVGLSLDVE